MKLVLSVAGDTREYAEACVTQRMCVIPANVRASGVPGIILCDAWDADLSDVESWITDTLELLDLEGGALPRGGLLGYVCQVERGDSVNRALTSRPRPTRN